MLFTSLNIITFARMMLVLYHAFLKLSRFHGIDFFVKLISNFVERNETTASGVFKHLRTSVKLSCTCVNFDYIA